MVLLRVLCLVAAALEDPDIACRAGVCTRFRTALVSELEVIQSYRYCLFLQDLRIWLGLQLVIRECRADSARRSLMALPPSPAPLDCQQQPQGALEHRHGGVSNEF